MIYICSIKWSLWMFVTDDFSLFFVITRKGSELRATCISESWHRISFETCCGRLSALERCGEQTKQGWRAASVCLCHRLHLFLRRKHDRQRLCRYRRFRTLLDEDRGIRLDAGSQRFHANLAGANVHFGLCLGQLWWADYSNSAICSWKLPQTCSFTTTLSRIWTRNKSKWIQSRRDAGCEFIVFLVRAALP